MRLFVILILVLLFFNYALLKSSNKKWFIPKKVKGCRLKVCNETLDYYPERRIKKLLNKKKTFAGYFGSVTEPADAKPHPVFRSLQVEDENLCETRRETIVPKVGYDDNYNPRFIVNVKGHFQFVTFEICVAKKCLFNQLPFGFKTKCVQRYHKVPLLHITAKGNLEYGVFSVPSTCVCAYSRDRE